MARSRTPSVEIEASLIEAASQLLEASGPEALTVRSIAAAAGVAPMGVYNRFSSKNGVVEELFCIGFTELATALTGIAALDDAREALVEAGRRYLALGLAHPQLYQLMFGHAVAGFEPSLGAQEVAASAFDALVAAVKRAQQAGVLRDDDPALLAHMIWASVHGWVSLEIMGIGKIERTDTHVEVFLDALLKGLAP